MELVALQKDHGIATLTLSRGRVNALKSRTHSPAEKKDPIDGLASKWALV